MQFITQQHLRSTSNCPGNATGVRSSKVRLRTAACTATWFAAGITRKDSEKVVKAGNHGDFLVRLSSSMDKYNLVVNDSGTVCTFSIKVSDSTAKHSGANTNACIGEARKFFFGGEVYDSLDMLISDLQSRCFKSVVTDRLFLATGC